MEGGERGGLGLASPLVLGPSVPRPGREGGGKGAANPLKLRQRFQ